MSELIRTRPIMNGIWQLSDPLDDRAYLVVGTERALLIDTMVGCGDLIGTVRGITEFPLTVGITHAHYDHIGGCPAVPEVLASRPEAARLASELGRGRRARQEIVNAGIVPADVRWAIDADTVPATRIVAEGDEIDLGERHITIVELPGHTDGSIGFLLHEERILFSGDAVTPTMCLFFDESLSAEAWLKTVRAMERLPFDRFWTGHHEAAFTKDDLASFEEIGDFARRAPYGMDWQHNVLPEFTGTIYLPDEMLEVEADSPAFRAVIGRHVPRPKPSERRRLKEQGWTNRLSG